MSGEEALTVSENPPLCLPDLHLPLDIVVGFINHDSGHVDKKYLNHKQLLKTDEVNFTRKRFLSFNPTKLHQLSNSSGEYIKIEETQDQTPNYVAKSQSNSLQYSASPAGDPNMNHQSISNDDSERPEDVYSRSFFGADDTLQESFERESAEIDLSLEFNLQEIQDLKEDNIHMHSQLDKYSREHQQKVKDLEEENHSLCLLNQEL